MRQEGLNDDKKRTYVSGSGGRLVFVRCFSAGAGRGGEGREERTDRTFIILCFCDGEDYRGWRKKSLNTRDSMLKCKVPLRHCFYTISPTMWSHLMGIHQTFRVIYCFHFKGGGRHFPLPLTLLRKSVSTYQTTWYLNTEYRTMRAKTVSINKQIQ
jgi:hypothetical protein